MHLFSLVLAANELRKDGNDPPSNDALKISRDFNPGGAVTTVAVRVA